MIEKFRRWVQSARDLLNTPGLGRRVVTLLSIGLVALLITNLAALYLINRSAEYADDVQSAQTVRRQARTALIAVLSAESAHRAFLLTEDPAQASRAEEELERLRVAMDDLRVMAGDDFDLAPLTAEIARVATERAGRLGVTLDLARQGRVEDAVRIIASGAGQALTDELRVHMERIDEITGERLATADRRATLALRTTWGMNVVTALLIMGLALAIGWLVRRYIIEMRDARLALDRLNAGLEDQVRDRTLALTRANDEIQRFAYIVSHDLRAPLVNVMGYTSELQAAGKALEAQIAAVEAKSPKLLSPEAAAAVREDMPEAIGFIRASTEKMDRLINAILRLSREGRRALTPERLDLGAIARNVAASVNHQVEAQGAAIEVGDLPVLESDRLTVEQLIGNLVDNAVKYLSPDRPGRIRIDGEARRDGMVEVRVTDNGRGIAERDLERIFELFRRAGKQDRPGEGLGLAFVRNGARRLGGDVTVRSRAGEGSTFCLILPRKLTLNSAGESA